MEEQVLSSQDEELLNSLEPPDVVSKPTYVFDSFIQKEILALLIHDCAFLVQTIGLIKPEYFVAESHRFIFQEIDDFFRRHFEGYGKGGEVIQLEYLKQEIKSKVQGQARMRYTADLVEIDLIYDGNTVSRSYLLENIVEFARQQATKEAVFKVCGLMKAGKRTNWNKVYDTLKHVFTVAPQTDEGLDFFNKFEDFLEYIEKMDEQVERFTSGFAPIDDRINGGGLARGEIGAYVGLSGAGKSLALVQAAVKNIAIGKKVLYISTEMDQYRLGQRFTSHFTFMPQEVAFIKENKQRVVSEIHSWLKSIPNNTDNKLLWIKQFPPGTANIDDLRAYVNQLRMKGFHPDLLIVDYIGELRDFPDMPTWESRQRLVRDLRGLGVEENVCILTALQPNRQGRKTVQEGSVMDDGEIGDSYGQIRPLDACWSINQTKEDQKANVGRIFIMKHRNGISKVELCFKRVVSTLGFEQISYDTYKNELSKVKMDVAEGSHTNMQSYTVR